MLCNYTTLNFHSFPTRRSSDLQLAARPEVADDVVDLLGGLLQHLGDGPLAEVETVVRAGVDVDEPLQPEPRSQLLPGDRLDRKSTRLNSSHLGISYAVFCLKKK